MFKLAPYFAGGLAALVAMDFAPPVKSAIDQWAGASTYTSDVQLVNVVDRSLKGDRLVPAHRPVGHVSISVISKGAGSPVTTVGDNGRATAKPGQAAPQKPAGKLPVGCDPAFSPLAASASLNFASRCIAENLTVPLTPLHLA